MAAPNRPNRASDPGTPPGFHGKLLGTGPLAGAKSQAHEMEISTVAARINLDLLE